MHNTRMQFEDNTGPDQPVQMPFTYLMDTVVYVDEQKM